MRAIYADLTTLQRIFSARRDIEKNARFFHRFFTSETHLYFVILRACNFAQKDAAAVRLWCIMRRRLRLIVIALIHLLLIIRFFCIRKVYILEISLTV